MKLYLIRHGETVDNVAGLYAGTRDSQLTNHGVEQTERLGHYFARQGVRFSHIFASPLSRAFKTAVAVQRAQVDLSKDGKHANTAEIVKVQELIERDFGFYEGKPFNARKNEEQFEKDKDKPGFVDVESKEALAKRIDRFLDQYLLPLLDDNMAETESVVAVVAHGMLLSHFWRRLLLRLPKDSLSTSSEVAVKKDGAILEYIGGWSNTGFMELSFQRNSTSHGASIAGAVSVQDNLKDGKGNATTLQTPVPPRLGPEEAKIPISQDQMNGPAGQSEGPRTLSGWSTKILAVDSTLHLLGLKRQRGGIGSLAHDEGQRKLDAFFKKPRLT
jgi:broad specificity phosphatase PhoE